VTTGTPSPLGRNLLTFAHLRNDASRSPGQSYPVIRCLTCHRRTENPKFCSRRCAAVTNNRLFPKRLPKGHCSHCGKALTVHRGICDICRSRLTAWSRDALGERPIWERPDRSLVLDLVGLGLWWGEGRKDRHKVSVCNSDPAVLALVVAWLREVYRVPLRKFRAGVHIHRDLDSEATLRFWRKVTGIPRGQFHKIQVFRARDRLTKRRGARKMLYGVCTVSVYDVRLFDVILRRLSRIKSLVRASDSGPLTRLVVNETLKSGSPTSWVDPPRSITASRRNGDS